MRYKQKIIIAVLNVFACVILFVCIGLAVMGGPFAGAGADHSPQAVSFFYRYGMSIAFISAMFFLALLYVHQKILFQGQKKLDGVSRSFGDLDVRLKHIFEFLPLGVIETTRDGEIIFCNPMGAYLFGFHSAKEFMRSVNQRPGGMRSLYMNPAARDELTSRLYEKREERCKFQDRFLRSDGKTSDLAFDVFLRYDDGRNEECIFGFIQDVTERMEFERMLQESEARYRGLIEQANAAIFCIDGSGRIQYMNAFGRKCFGYTMADLEDKTLIGRIFNNWDINNGVFPEENPVVCKDGHKVWVAWSSRAIRDENGSVAEILVIGTDITASKQLEQSLEQQLASEMLLEKISSQFAGEGADKVEESMSFALDKMNAFLGAEQAYSCFFNEKGFVEKFYLSSCGEPDALRRFIDQFFLSDFSWWFEKFQGNGSAVFLHNDEIPPDKEAMCQAIRVAGLEWVCVVPIIQQDRFVGFIGFNGLASQSEWQQKQVDVLKVCGTMVSHYLEKKKFQDEISEAKDRFDIAVRGAYLGMYDWDIQSGNVIFNDIWFRMIGYSPHEFPQTVDTWKALLHPDDSERVLKSLDDYLKGSSSFYHTEFRLRTKDGSWKWILAEGNIKKKAADGSPVRMVGLQRDITELKSIEHRLRSEKDLVESLIENMPAGIFAKDVRKDFRFLIWNRRMEELFGMKRHDVLGKTDFELFDHDLANLYLKDDMEVVKRGIVKHGIHERVQTARGERWVETIKVPVFAEDGTVSVIFGILDDVTEKEELQISLQQTQKMQAIGQLAAGVAHEIKNPLAVILLAAEGLAMVPEVLDNQKIQNKVDMIKNASKKANKVVMELLKFSRLTDVEMECIDLHHVIDDAYFLAHNRGKEKYIDFQKDYHQGALMCFGNPVLLEQVFVNLFNNSIDAIERFGQIMIRTKLHSAAGRKKTIAVEVEDNGPGIPKEILPKIFDPFYTTKDAAHGTGLGLSTAFAIIDKHNGRIRVDNTKTEGTRFIITLPFFESCPETAEGNA